MTVKRQVKKRTSKPSPLSGQWADYLRPKRIDDLILPEVKKQQIRSIIDDKQKPPNAVLVTGETGSGKTTLARLVAAHLGGISEAYEKSTNERYVFPKDIIEVNSGEDNGIEHIRELISSVSYKPRQLKRRIVIMDEVHLLSRQAVSALLKPIEEPSSTTIWILCTNRPEKLREEIKRRCFNIELPYLNRRESVDLLTLIAERSGVSRLFDYLQWGEEKPEKSLKPCEVLFKEVALTIAKSDLNLAREMVTSFQLLLKSIRSSRPKTLDEALDTLEELVKNTGFETEDFAGVDSFIDTVSNDPQKAIGSILEVASNPESYNQLYYRLRSRIAKGSRDTYTNLLFIWCVDASAWSIHSGMRHLDYVAARLAEHVVKNKGSRK